MSTATLLDGRYEKRKRDLLGSILDRLRPAYSAEELAALRIDRVNPAILSQRSGRGFVDRDILETVLGNLLECVAPGSHNALEFGPPAADFAASIGEVADQLYAMVAQSHLAAGADEDLEDRALAAACSVLWELVELKGRARWNRFASLKDPAVWDAYLRRACGIDETDLAELDFAHPHRPRHRRARPGLLPRVPRRPPLRPGLRLPDAAGHEHIPGVAGPVLPRRGPCPDAQRPPRRGAAPGTRAGAAAAEGHRRAGGALLPGRHPSRDADRGRQLPRPSAPRPDHRPDRRHRFRVPLLSLHPRRSEPEAAPPPSGDRRLRLHRHRRRPLRTGAHRRPLGDRPERGDLRSRGDRPEVPGQRLRRHRDRPGGRDHAGAASCWART